MSATVSIRIRVVKANEMVGYTVLSPCPIMLPVYLVPVAGYELPPLPAGYTWIEMPDSFALPYLQREILKAGYEYLMG